MLNALSSIMMVSGLAFMGTAPFVADYIVLAAGLVGLVLALASRDEVLRSWPSGLLLGVLVLVGLTIPFVYRSEMDLLPLAAFAPLLLAPGIAALLRRSPEWLSPYAFAMACLVGAVAASLVGLAEYAEVEGARAGAGNNPIHYGGIATMLGFMALTGTVAGRAPLRLLFLLGPAAALVAVLLSGSRGPLMAWVALAVVSAPLVLWWSRRDPWLLGVFALGAVSAVAVLLHSTENRAIEALGRFVAALTSGEMGTSDVARSAMYHSAWQAFIDSPLVGQGYGQIMPFAQALHPEVPVLAQLDNYHSDIANFAAMSGIPGLLAYGFVILSPLVLLFSAPARANRGLVLGSLMLVVGYGALGLTNAMFGLLPQTMLFVLMLGYLMALQQKETGVR